MEGQEIADTNACSPVVLKTYQQAYNILPKANQGEALWVLPFLILNGLVEMLGVGTVLPFVTAVTNPDVIEKNRLFRAFYQYVQPGTYDQFLVILFICASLIFVSVNVLGALAFWASARFANRARHALSSKLLGCYLRKPYQWHLGQNSTEMSKDILSEIDVVTDQVLMKLAELANRVFSAGFIFIGLLVLDYRVALSTVLIIGLVYRIIFGHFKQHLEMIGQDRSKANSARFRAVAEALSVVREVRLFGRRAYLQQRFDAPAGVLCDREISQKLVSRIPKYLIETLAIVVLFGLTVLLIVNGHPTAVPLVALYIMAIWRLVPAIQDIYKNAASIRFYQPSLEAIRKQILAAPVPGWEVLKKTTPLPFNSSLEIENGEFSYPTSQECVLSDLNIEISKNTSLAVVGRTGEGKSTLADLLAGNLELGSGALKVDGNVLDAPSLAKWRENVRMVPQEIFLLDDTVARNIAIGIPDEKIDYDKLERVAKAAQLHDYISTHLSDGYSTPLGERGVSLSGGQRQRVGIARALYDEPDLLILDESTSALDELTEKAVLEAIRNLKGERTVILIAHRMSTVQECEQVCFIENGRIKALGQFCELNEELFLGSLKPGAM